MAGQTRIDGNLIDTGTDPNDIVSVSVGDARYPRLSQDNTLAGNLTVDGDFTVNGIVTGIDTDKISEGNSSVEVVDVGTGHVAITTDGSERVRVDSSGRVTMPFQPAFMVGFTTSGNLSLADNTIIPFDDDGGDDLFDRGNNFNTSTHRFTAPVSGVYCFIITVQIGSPGSFSSQLKVNGTPVRSSVDTLAGFKNDSNQSSHTPLLVNLTAGDYAEVFTRNGAYAVFRNHSWFLGYLVG